MSWWVDRVTGGAVVMRTPAVPDVVLCAKTGIEGPITNTRAAAVAATAAAVFMRGPSWRNLG
jgi:hypothetical protein